MTKDTHLFCYKISSNAFRAIIVWLKKMKIFKQQNIFKTTEIYKVYNFFG